MTPILLGRGAQVRKAKLFPLAPRRLASLVPQTLRQKAFESTPFLGNNSTPLILSS